MANKNCVQTNYPYLQTQPYNETQTGVQEYASTSFTNQTTNSYNYMHGYPLQSNQMGYNTHTSSGSLEYSSNFLLDAQLPAWSPNDTAKLNKNLNIDKPNTIGILSKDLSPCSNLDLIFPDFERNLLSKDKFDPCLYNKSNNKETAVELPSCSQIYYEDVNSENKSMKLCALPRPSCDLDYLCSETVNPNDPIFSSYPASSNGKNLRSCYVESCQDNYSKFYEQADPLPCIPSQNEVTLPHCYLQSTDNFIGISGLDDALNDSNEESDIIVEESEDDITEVAVERPYQCLTQCVVCNTLYNALGPELYLITSVAPLTVTTQTPIYTKLQEILGSIIEEQYYMCNDCLSAINNLDQLHATWEQCRNSLLMKYAKTCKEKSFHYSETIHQKTYIDNNTQNNNNTNCVYENTNIDKLKVKKVQLNKSKIRRKAMNFKYKCKVCKKMLSLRVLLKTHLNSHKRKQRYLCEFCGQKFVSLKAFKYHKNLHGININNKNDKVNEKKQIKFDAFLCSICKKPFRTKSHLKDHENFCSGRLPFECKHCDKKFSTISKLKSHCRLKHEKKFVSICSICNIGFVKVSDYKAHVSSHTNDKKFSCKKCDKSYKTLSNLNFHMKIHEKKMPFLCEFCNKGFMRKEYLEAHINNHKGVKNFSCPQCDKKFVAQKYLDAHMKYHDGTLSMKTCKVCGKNITSGMEEHIRTHNNLREFECEICFMKFNTKGALAKHKKRKHEEKKL